MHKLVSSQLESFSDYLELDELKTKNLQVTKHIDTLENQIETLNTQINTVDVSYLLTHP